MNKLLDQKVEAYNNAHLQLAKIKENPLYYIDTSKMNEMFEFNKKYSTPNKQRN